jgi:uncharacterized protein YndB with AHSA1/START domain
VRFDRRYPHPVERVWRAVTEPAELEHWFPCSVELDLREGGPMTFTFREHEMDPMPGRVTELDPPRRFCSREQAARDAAGWHVCLDRLERLLAGAPVPGQR